MTVTHTYYINFHKIHIKPKRRRKETQNPIYFQDNDIKKESSEEKKTKYKSYANIIHLIMPPCTTGAPIATPTF